MSSYSPEYKRGLAEKVFTSPGKSIEELSKEFNVSRASLFRWVKCYGAESAGIVKRVSSYKGWSVAQKLRVLLETQSLGDQELGEYLRKNGLYYATLVDWKADILDEVKKNSKENKLPKAESSYLRKIRELERELKMKDKALREATALLALKKKVESIWGQEEDEKSPGPTESNAKPSSKKQDKKAAD